MNTDAGGGGVAQPRARRELVAEVELEPVPFPQATGILRGSPEGDVHDLVCFSDGSCVVSCWTLPWRARIAVLFGAPLWLHVLARRHPPVSLTISRGGPFEPPRRPEGGSGATP